MFAVFTPPVVRSRIVISTSASKGFQRQRARIWYVVDDAEDSKASASCDCAATADTLIGGRFRLGD
jgi:hypothetical protein